MDESIEALKHRVNRLVVIGIVLALTGFATFFTVVSDKQKHMNQLIRFEYEQITHTLDLQYLLLAKYSEDVLKEEPVKELTLFFAANVSPLHLEGEAATNLHNHLLNHWSGELLEIEKFEETKSDRAR